MSIKVEKRKHRRTKKMMFTWTFELSTDYAPQTATVIEVIRQAFQERGANVAIKERFA